MVIARQIEITVCVVEMFVFFNSSLDVLFKCCYRKMTAFIYFVAGSFKGNATAVN